MNKNYKINKVGVTVYSIVLLMIIFIVILINLFFQKIEKEGIVSKESIETTIKNEGVINPEEVLSKMTLEEKIGQLFIITPEALTNYSEVTVGGEVFKASFDQFPIGGIILFGQNLESPEQVALMNENFQKISQERLNIPMFVSIDEEGGEVVRIANKEGFNMAVFKYMNEIGANENEKEAYEVGHVIGKYLKELNFNLNFSPVMDVTTEGENLYINQRSFGSDPVLVGKMGSEVVKGLHKNNIKTAIKHFPGLGSTVEDTHSGMVMIDKSLEELKEKDFIPFKAGIEAGTDFVMVCGVSVPSVVGDDTPSSLSKIMVTDILKTELGYKGLVITDAMNMGAIIENYSSKEAAKKAFEAGVDVLLMPENFEEAYYALLDAVQSGEISEKRVDESVIKILELKGSLE